VRSEGPITVAVGQLGDVIGRGLLEILRGARGLEVVGAGLDYAALQDVVARGEAQVVVLDEDSAVVPTILRGLRSKRSGSGVGLVVLAHRPSRARIARVLAYGVSVCLSTDASAREIVRGVGLAAGAGGQVFVSASPDTAQAARAVGMRSLTRRESDVLELLSTGHKTVEIARVLQVGTETVRTHTRHVYRKLGVSSRGELLGIEQ
jgi:DNA-binding NarL/FixJ family response regulator